MHREIARDIVDTFDTVLTLLEDIIKELPALQAYINIYGSSKLQLLREPLVDIYAGFIVLGLQALKLFGRSAHRKWLKYFSCRFFDTY